MSTAFRETDFNQQRVREKRSLPTPHKFVCGFLMIGLFFVPLGIALRVVSEGVEVYKVRYDNACTRPSNATSCVAKINISIPDGIANTPIFFYYQIDNFYQNHRRYVKSRSDNQLRAVTGLTDSYTLESDCDPISHVDTPQGKRILYPCGLIANSYFNDTFLPPQICVNVSAPPVVSNSTNDTSSNCSPLNWSDQDIAWESDVQSRFKVDPTFNTSAFDAKYSRLGTGGYELPLPVDRTLITWMRTSAFPQFRKLRYVLNSPIPPDSVISLSILNTFPVESFEGAKWAVLSSTTVLGGNQTLLGNAYIGVGVICVIVALFFALKSHFCSRPLDDVQYYTTLK